MDPGARLVFTVGGTVRPRSTAFFASRPAATITTGFDVFVHDVIAAITTDPSVSGARAPSILMLIALGFTATATPPADPPAPPAILSSNAVWKLLPICPSATRSCGRRGPATLGSRLDKSSV